MTLETLMWIKTKWIEELPTVPFPFGLEDSPCDVVKAMGRHLGHAPLEVTHGAPYVPEAPRRPLQSEPDPPTTAA